MPWAFPSDCREVKFSLLKHTTMSNSDNTVQVMEGVTFKVTWARSNDNEATNDFHIAQFSGILYVNGVKFQVINKLSILNKTNMDTGVSKVYIGSMFETQRKRGYEDPKKIFAITWFPDTRTDPKSQALYDTFVENCVTAVTKFISNQKEKMEASMNQNTGTHTALTPLKEVGAQMRSLFR